MFDAATIEMLGNGILETLYMTIVSTLLGYVLGLPIGVLLVISDSEGIRPNSVLYKILDFIVNILRSVPFLILLIAIIPLTRLIVGTSIGPTAAIVPLVVASAPFIGRMVESSLREVDKGLIEASQAMGAGTMQIIWKVLLPEARPSLLVGAAISTTTILGYSAMAGICGGGGLGDIAIRYGYQRYEDDIMIVTIILLILIVQIFQVVGMKIAEKSDKRK